jgi:hypothetical protein
MSKTLDHVRALLDKHGIRQIDLVRAGIGAVPARKLLGKMPGEVSIAVVERALVLIRRELTTRRPPRSP